MQKRDHAPKKFHDLQPAALLLCINNYKDYFFNVKFKSNPDLNFKKAFAFLRIGKKNYEGMLEIIISHKKQIYHLMFNDKIKHKPEQLFDIISSQFEDSLENAEEDNGSSIEWCNKNGFEIVKEDDKYVINLDMPTSTTQDMDNLSRRILYVYPNKLRSPLL